MKKVIKLSESELHNIVENSVKKILREAEDLEPIDFYTFIDIMDANKWNYNEMGDITTKDGRNGVRYHISPNKNSSSIDELMQQLKSSANKPDNIILSSATYRYAPEIKTYVLNIIY